ncbi:MAG: hypothetical protein R3E50_10095 [Halioglobus sp.]
MFNWSSILPPPANGYRGHPLALYFLVLLALRKTFAGAVHYFAADGGSGTIAGIPLQDYPDGAVMAIVNSFGVYGIGHLLEALLLWLVILRYRVLIPLAYLLSLCAEVLAVFLLHYKPLPVLPPGEVGVYILAPLTLVFLLLSIREQEDRASAGVA